MRAIRAAAYKASNPENSLALKPGNFELTQREVFVPVPSEMSAALRRAFHTALLLTGNMLSAERAVALAIDSLDPEDCTAEACLFRTIEESIRCCFGISAEQTQIGVADTWPVLPVELRRVIQMKAALRHSFVVRALLGFPEDRAARLLQLDPREVRARTSEAMRWLAGVPETATAFLASDSARRATGASLPVNAVLS